MTELEEQTITSVLLTDGWHPVVAGSFKIDRAKFPGTASGDVSFAVHTATWKEAHNSTPAIIITASLNSVLAVQRME